MKRRRQILTSEDSDQNIKEHSYKKRRFCRLCPHWKFYLTVATLVSCTVAFSIIAIQRYEKYHAKQWLTYSPDEILERFYDDGGLDWSNFTYLEKQRLRLLPGDVIDKIYPEEYSFYNLNGIWSNSFMRIVHKFIEPWLSLIDTPDKFAISSTCSYDFHCELPPAVYVLKHSQFTCKDIVPLLQKIRKCVRYHGDHCEFSLTLGFWRDVWKVELNGKPYVLKTMKPRHKYPREELRFVRESVLLQFLQDSSFIVPEVGHCNVAYEDPDFGYATLSPYYPKNFHEFLMGKEWPRTRLIEALQMVLQIVQGLDSLHRLDIGIFVHADLQPRQFMVTKDRQILLNDFNRGKWLPSRLDGFERGRYYCYFCGARSKGRWRAPEEYQRKPLNEKLDIYSLGMVIWSMFSYGSQPLMEFTKPEVYTKVPKGYRPILSKRMPPELQAIIIECWSQIPSHRPSTEELLQRIGEIVGLYNGTALGNTALGQLPPFERIQDNHFTAGELLPEPEFTWLSYLDQ